MGLTLSIAGGSRAVAPVGRARLQWAAPAAGMRSTSFQVASEPWEPLIIRSIRTSTFP